MARPTLKTQAEKGWMVLLTVSFVVVLVAALVGTSLGKWFAQGLSYEQVADEYPFTRDRLDNIVRVFEEREGQYEALKGAPVTVVDPAI